MEYQKINIKNTQLAVYQKGEGDATILFVHGNSLDAQSFRKQFNSVLAKKYRLIAFDLPGHGNSDNAVNPENTYNLLGYVEVLKDLIKELQLTNYYLVGHSIGGHIAIEASTDLDLQLKGLMIFGAPPISIPLDMENAYLPHPAMELAFKSDLNEVEAKTFVSGCVLGEKSSEMVESVLNTDPKARGYLAESIGALKFKDETEIVKCLNIPIAILQGEHEAIVNGDYFNRLNIPKLWKEKILVITNCGHSPHYEQPEAVNEHICKFVS